MKKLAQTKQVRVLPEDYEKITSLAEKRGISYAEALHELINKTENKGFMWGFLAGAGVTTLIGGNND